MGSVVSTEHYVFEDAGEDIATNRKKALSPLKQVEGSSLGLRKAQDCQEFNIWEKIPPWGIQKEPVMPTALALDIQPWELCEMGLCYFKSWSMAICFNGPITVTEFSRAGMLEAGH